jgi:hypothetical protein
MSAENRLDSLGKLYLVPAFAVRELVLSKLKSDDERIGAILKMRHDLLVQEADKTQAISESDVESVYEKYRYGRRLSFQLYLLPSNLPAIADPERLQASLTSLLEEQGATAEPKRVRAEEEYESEEPLRNVVICDYERFDDTLEIRYKYQVIHRFLNEDEEPDHIYQTRYGFMWLNVAERYLVILSKDEKVTRALTGVLSKALKVWPIPVKLSKELLDEHFPLERAKRLTHLDPQSRVRQSISGDTEALEQYHTEILGRDAKYLRPGALYEEDIEEGLMSGLGVTARKGKLYLTKTLPTSVVRRWAHRRLPELVYDLQDRVARDPQSSVRASPIISHLRLSDEGKAYIIRIVQALLQAKREAVSSVSLGISPLVLYQALGSNRLDPFIHFECEECHEICSRCANCESTNLVMVGNQVRCGDCDAALTLDSVITLKCLNGHSSNVALDEALGFVPKHILERPVYRVLNSAGVFWQQGKEHFYIEGDMLHHLFGGPDTPITVVKGDNIVAQIGEGAKEVIVGKNISVGGRDDEQKA